VFRDVMIWTTLVVTVWSCLGYVRRSIQFLRTGTSHAR